MFDETASPSLEPFKLELEKWEFDRATRERELRIQEGELDLKRAEQNAAQWRNPLVLGIFAAAIATAGNGVVSYTNENSQRELEAQKAEQARILEMIKTGDPDKAAENLRFLVSAGLVTNAPLKKSITDFLSTRKPGSGPTMLYRLTSPSVGLDVPRTLKIGFWETQKAAI